MKIEINEPQWYWQKGMRSNQEDALYPLNYDERHPFFIVCDGVGGNDCGEVASHLVCESFGEFLPSRFEKDGQLDSHTFKEVLVHAWEKLYNNRKISQSMATTLTFAAITNDGVFLAHMGDSRIYQIRPGEGEIFRTEDHSLVNELIKNKKISPQEAVYHPKRHVITRCLTVQENSHNYTEATVHIIRDVKPGDIFLLCSDGVYEEASGNYITEVLSEDISLSEKKEKLAQTTFYSQDNNTAILLEINSVSKDKQDSEENICFETHLSSYEIPSLLNQLSMSAQQWMRKFFK